MKKVLISLAVVVLITGCSTWMPQPAQTSIRDYEVHNQAGLRLAEQGRHAEALRHFEEAARLAPQLPALHNNLGYAYLLQGSGREAVAAFETALRLDPAYVTARQNLALARARDTAPSPAMARAPAAPAAPVQSEAGALVRVAPHVYELRSTRPALLQRDAAPRKAPVRPFKLEVANANGIAGMARRVARRLQVEGTPAARLTNGRAFSQSVTLIQYRKGYSAEANRLREQFPPSARLVQSDRISGDIHVRVVLGRDMRSPTRLAKSDAD
jgi:tetratricopeptide (TPR) repeat protein